MIFKYADAEYYDYLQIHDFPLTTDDLQSLQELSLTHPFSWLIAKLFDLLQSAYRDRFPMSFSFDKAYDDAKNELLLSILNYLSLCTSDLIESVEKFTHSADTYSELSAYLRALSPLSPPERTFSDNTKRLATYAEQIVTGDPDNPSITFHPFIRSQICMSGTPLADFIYLHMGILAAKKDSHNKEKISSENLSNSHRYYFYKEGRCLFYELQRILNSKTIPYTWKGRNVLTSFHLNNLLSDLYGVYHKKDFNNDLMERLLFLINVENIFEITLVKNIFDSYHSFFHKHKNITDHGKFVFNEDFVKPAEYMGTGEFTKADLNLLLGFKASLFLMNDLRECPLATIRLRIWETYIKRYFEFGRNYAQYGDLNTIFASIKYPMPEEPLDIAFNSQEMANCFFYALMKTYRCFPEPEDKVDLESTTPSRLHQAMNTLKKKIYEYLINTPANDASWSLLESSTPEQIKIPSLPHEYFDHQVAYTFYLTSPNDMAKYHIENIYDGYGITQYLKYILTRKKLSKQKQAKSGDKKTQTTSSE